MTVLEILVKIYDVWTDQEYLEMILRSPKKVKTNICHEKRIFVILTYPRNMTTSVSNQQKEIRVV